MSLLILVLSWFAIGFICMFIMWISEMRGKEFNPDFFDEEGTAFVSLMLFLCGYISLILILSFYIEEKNIFTKLVYKIANIGIKKKEESKEV